MHSDSSFHRPVLLEEVISLLEPRSPKKYLDCTVGGGGHGRAILEASSPGGRLWGLDRDAEAVKAASTLLEPYGDRVKLSRANFARARELFPAQRFNGILLDLGVSSHRLDTPARGFSCDLEGPLDMRMDTGQGKSAAEILARSSQERITQILRLYGEEPLSRRIAREIVKARRLKPVQTTSELARLVRRSVPRRSERKSLVRVFQALRIAVNDELGALDSALESLFEMLVPEARLAIISFHSLEDRKVKRHFKCLAESCTCPPDLPLCVCNRKPEAQILTPKPVRPSARETASNPRCRSARLRVLIKVK